MAEFRCFVSTQTGLPIANAAIRVLNALSADQTVKLFGASPVYTSANGVFSRPTPPIGSLTGFVPLGIYTIVATAPGYESAQIDTEAGFTGSGSFTLVLEMVAGPSEPITLPDSLYVSPLFPVEVLVPAAAPSAAWEYIEATITRSDGTSSVIEVQTSGDSARLNLQARLELDSSLHLVGDDEPALSDPDFSDTFSVSLASLTPSGRRDLETEFSLQVANVFPAGEQNDLSNFTNVDGLAEWLTPWAELPKFQGHYADAMLWIPIAQLGGYVLRIDYKDINRASLSSDQIAISSAVFTPGKVARIRIPEAITGAHYATLTLLHNSEPVSQPLNVRFIHG